MSVAQAAFTYAQKIELTNYVNAYRAKHNSPPLLWDDTISAFAQEYSLYLVTNNLFQHSNKEGYGENLAYFQGYPNEMMTLIKKSIDLWYDEIKLYNFNYPGYSSSTGHFTCLVWKSTTSFGMGYSFNNDTKVVDITMNTAPPGNIIGQFKENVNPPNGTVPQPMPTPYPTPTPSPSPMPYPMPSPSPAPMPTPVPVPTPMPYPTPTPTPVPAPIPYPTPVPFPPYDATEDIRRIVYLIYSLINMINRKRPMRTLIYSVDEIISNLKMIADSAIANKMYLLNRMYYVRYALQTGRSSRLVIYALNEIAQSLSPTA
jgi:hypothetical protein